MIINKANYHGSRGSSSRAKKLEAANKISFARFNSRTSASRSLIFFASSVVVPGRWPELIAAYFTQPRNVSALTPVRCPIRITAAFNDNSASSFRASSTSRNAPSRNSCGYFLCAAIVLILPGNQTLHQTRGGSQHKKYDQHRQNTTVMDAPRPAGKIRRPHPEPNRVLDHPRRPYSPHRKHEHRAHHERRHDARNQPGPLPLRGAHRRHHRPDRQPGAWPTIRRPPGLSTDRQKHR